MGNASGCPLSTVFPGTDDPHSGNRVQSDNFAVADTGLEAGGRGVADLRGAGSSRGKHH